MEISVTVAKFGGSALGIDGELIPKVIKRIMELGSKDRVVAVFSAPLTYYEDKRSSMTDIAIKVGKSYAASNPVEVEVLRETYERIARKHVAAKYIDDFPERPR